MRCSRSHVCSYLCALVPKLEHVPENTHTHMCARTMTCALTRACLRSAGRHPKAAAPAAAAASGRWPPRPAAAHTWRAYVGCLSSLQQPVSTFCPHEQPPIPRVQAAVPLASPGGGRAQPSEGHGGAAEKVRQAAAALLHALISICCGCERRDRCGCLQWHRSNRMLDITSVWMPYVRECVCVGAARLLCRAASGQVHLSRCYPFFKPGGTTVAQP